MNQNFTDQQIVAGILLGGKDRNQAIRAIYDQNRAFLVKFLINKSNAQEYVKQPDDIIWESIEAVVINILEGKYVALADKPLAAYLTQICKNLWHKFLSQESNRKDRENLFGSETEFEEEDISSLISSKERWNYYLEVFENAGKNCKQIFTLWLVDGMSGKEIAEVMIIEGKLKSEASVRNAKSDCLDKITKQLTVK